MEIDPRSGLPKEIGVFEEIEKTQQQIKIETVKRRYGKITTLVSGFSNIDIKDIAKELKQRLACGGTVKNNVIELQGEHKGKVKEALIKMGFDKDSIEE